MVSVWWCFVDVIFIFEIVRSVFKSPNNSGDGAFEVARNGSVCALGIRIVL